MSYRVEFTSAAAKEVRKPDPHTRRRVVAGLSALEQEPRPSGVRKLTGFDNAWRIRIGDYRVLYEVADDVVLVTVFRVAHRREAYGDLVALRRAHTTTESVYRGASSRRSVSAQSRARHWASSAGRIGISGASFLTE